ncbi:hypothetical protein SETIT_7G127800v2 [Setaria italica]|uniref:Uncharacterized protein n=3 Tax=Setaria TaxID=4554 RepID=A0A368RV32_SETIT|nr:hypothetical protein SETIT_7G127800v2 [Setaria italica]TKW04837.1 hypothetical protein SEVIR_7G135900v2 [Setaria viridis]
MFAAASEMCASIMPHHVMRGASAASPPPTTSKMQSCCPSKLLGPSAAMIATPHLKSRLHLPPRGRGRRSYSR